MPEFPDIIVYREALERRVAGATLETVLVRSPFLLRTFDPPLEAIHGRRCQGVSTLGKRIVFAFEDDLSLIVHLMIAGRLHWKDTADIRVTRSKAAPKHELALFTFDVGRLTLTEAGSKRRAALSLVRGIDALRAHDPGGGDVLTMSLTDFQSRLTRANHTLKRALTDPRLFSGIGNAYSD